MKKSVILSILGLTVGAASSYGQGAVAFDTYTAEGGAGIITSFGAGPSIGLGLDNTFTGVLLWSATAISDSASTAGTAGDALNPLWNVGTSSTFATGAASAGYILGPNLNLTAGQIALGATVWLEVVAYNGTGWGQGGTYQGHSASFTATVASGTTLPDSSQMNNLQPFSVYGVSAVPEPATMALGGLGLAS
jgi:hypothetical protein